MSILAHFSDCELVYLQRGCKWAMLGVLTLVVTIVSCLIGAVIQLSDLVLSPTMNISNLIQITSSSFTAILWTLTTLFVGTLPFRTNRWSHTIQVEIERRAGLDPKDPIHSLGDLPLMLRLTQIGGSLASPPRKQHTNQNQRFFE